MFEKFTDKARKVMSLAQDEARNLGQMYVGTEHLLLALIKEGEPTRTTSPSRAGTSRSRRAPSACSRAPIARR